MPHSPYSTAVIRDDFLLCVFKSFKPLWTTVQGCSEQPSLTCTKIITVYGLHKGSVVFDFLSARKVDEERKFRWGIPESGSRFKLALEHPDGSLARSAFTNASSRYQASALPSQIASGLPCRALLPTSSCRSLVFPVACGSSHTCTSPPSPMSYERRIQRI
ncbi:hypothetical protein ARMGADRAFT_1089650 [Armillaria gallica]|uniref:Uncharacterized protein n=1 Tax=Armillaria gallica TaxID=47427 RepID=A0A2H3CX98_ARMGA|nr:hypothetical protein ARMGADRAFT_1089650 [Armillaria gallica]